MHRFSVLEAMDYFGNVPKVLYRQNIQDKSHLDLHYKPFKEKYAGCCDEEVFSVNNLNVILYDDPKGHSSVSSYELFIQDIESINN